MLHVTNGESAARVIREANLGGEVLSWDDVLHEGPVPDVADRHLRRIRARFIARCGWSDYERVWRQFAERDRKLARADEVLLWFEHDLFDQLQLLQVLNKRRSAMLIETDQYLGHMTADQIAALYPLRKPVSEAKRDTAVRAWKAFRSPDPAEIERLGDTWALPHLHAALTRHLEQFPSVRNGLSRTERQILEAVEAGARTRHEIFLADREKEARLFMGDASFWRWLDSLIRCRVPLLTTGLTLTTEGKQVLSGKSDHMKLNGINRWLGGVHLMSDRWRWDEAKHRLVGTAPV